MKRLLDPAKLLVLLFLGILGGVPLIQGLAEWRRGEAVGALELFRRPPTAAHLRTCERDLEEANWAVKRFRPWVQWARFTWLQEAGDKALLGRDGWLFYKPGVEYVMGEPPAATPAATHAPLQAILAFRDALSARGIHLLVLPAPNKESVYPDRLTRRAAHLSGAISVQTQELLARLQAAHVEVVDLFRVYAEARETGRPGSGAPLYLAQDTHWSPAGVDLAAKAVARRVLERGWIKPGAVEYAARPRPVQSLGDVLCMLRAPPLEARTPPETIPCLQVLRRDTGQPYQDSPEAEVLVLGDSFLRIYQRDEPGAAGFIAHLALELKQPLASHLSEGGGATQVRQELQDRPALLKHKKVVVWEFVERDIGLGAKGWQPWPLPSPAP